MTDMTTASGTSPALDGRVPAGDLATKWEDHKFSMKLVNANNKRKFDVIVVGTGLAGASAAATASSTGDQYGTGSGNGPGSVTCSR